MPQTWVFSIAHVAPVVMLWLAWTLPAFLALPALLIYLVRNVGNETAARNALKRHYSEIFE